MKLTLTVGHNVGSTPTLTHEYVVRTAADVLALDAFTAWQTVGYYHGVAEAGTRIEVCADKSEIMRIYDAVPALALDLMQESIYASIEHDAHADVAAAYGFDQYKVYARFDNGETWYSRLEE